MGKTVTFKKHDASLKMAKEILRQRGISNAKVSYSGLPYYFDFISDFYTGTVDTLHRDLVFTSFEV